jgi:hypothetical protein
MNEFELLDYIIPKVDSENKKAVNRFMLFEVDPILRTG